MGCIDIHSCDRSTYCLALALYKIQFEEIWYPETKLEVRKYFLYKIYEIKKNSLNKYIASQRRFLLGIISKTVKEINYFVTLLFIGKVG
jgi:hypothetical protein